MMLRSGITLSLLVACLILVPAHGFAATMAQDIQETGEDARQAELAAQEAARQEAAARAAEDAERQRIFTELDALDDSGRAPRPDPPKASDLLNAELVTFQQAIPKFRQAVKQFRLALSAQDKPDKPLKNIREQIDVLLHYFSDAKIKVPHPDPQEFRNYKPAELQRELLNYAERIGASLNSVVRAERRDVISTKTREFLLKLDGDLQRLKWMAAHAK